MKNLIAYIARSLVDDPTQVVITERSHGNTINYQLKVAKEDMGRVIGKGGRVANSIRVLLRVAAAKDAAKVNLDIVDPQ
jgi:hypothetical protein